LEQGKSIISLLILTGKQTVRNVEEIVDMGSWKKLMPDCNDLDTDLFLIAKASPLPTGALWQDNL